MIKLSRTIDEILKVASLKSTMKNSSNHNSDSDDWTLISPPHSSSSSPDREQPLNYLNELNRAVSEDSPIKAEDDENSIEIDFRGESSDRASSAELGFQPLDTTSDDSDLDCRRPSLTISERDEYVDLSKRDLEDSNKADDGRKMSIKENIHVLKGNVMTIDEDQKTRSQGPNSDSKTKEVGYLTSIKAMLDDLNESVQASNRRVPLRFIKLNETTEAPASYLNRVINNDLAMCLICMFAWLSFMIVVLISADVFTPAPVKSDNELPSVSSCDLKSKFSFGDSIPTSQQYVELKLLHSELSQCIKRQSPTSFKYYMSEDRFKDYDQLTNKPYLAGNGMNQKPYRGLVCYGQEYQWRERFDRLKADYDLDLRKLMHEAKKTVTNEMLEFHHPTLQFKLILNQIEYLDFLEDKRNKKQSEETIKYLKAENLQLIRRLNQPNDTGYQKVVVDLELQNAKLQRENEALKANLIGKAGPTYIRQSHELEQFERENLMLKQFHHQVAQEVSKSLKQFNLHIIDASTILDDHESLKTQLMLTRGYLRRLSEKISTVLLENESLKEELKEAYLFDTVNKANLPATHSGIFDSESSNNSNALIADNCMRNLIDAKERSNKLEDELNKLKQNCQRNVDLERSSERHLNKTGGEGGLSNDGFSKQRDWKQLSSSAETAIDKRMRGTMMSQEDNDDDDDGSVVDDLIVYLTNFLDNQVESWSSKNSLATVEHQDSSFSSSSSDDNTDGNPLFDGKQIADSAKIIPEYIREAVRPLTKKAQSHISEAMNSIVELLNTPLYMHLIGDNNVAEMPEMPNNSPAHVVTSDQSSPDPESPDEAPKTIPEVESERNITRVEETIAESVGKVDSVAMNFSPGWLFKRARQRKELRSEQVEPQSNWMLMRATLRETLRKAATYIDQHYIDSASETVDNKWQPKSSEQSQKKDGKQRKKSTKREHSRNKRSNSRNRSPTNLHQQRPIQREREEL